MGYCIRQTDSEIFIAKENIEKAYNALVSDYPSASEKPADIEDAMDYYRINPEFDDDGNIVDFEFDGEKYGNIDEMCETIAPYVKSGSYLGFAGEDGTHFRFFFKDGKVTEQTAKIIYEGDETDEKTAKAMFIMYNSEGTIFHAYKFVSTDEAKLAMIHEFTNAKILKTKAAVYAHPVETIYSSINDDEAKIVQKTTAGAEYALYCRIINLEKDEHVFTADEIPRN